MRCGTGVREKKNLWIVWTHQCCTTCRSACRFLVDFVDLVDLCVDCYADPLVDLCVDPNVDLHVELVASPTEDLSFEDLYRKKVAHVCFTKRPLYLKVVHVQNCVLTKLSVLAYVERGNACVILRSVYYLTLCPVF